MIAHVIALLALVGPGGGDAALGGYILVQDTLQLAGLQDSAVLHDPRLRQAALHERATALRLRNLSAEALPQFRFTGEAAHQSEVASLPITLPGNEEPPRPPKDRYEIALNVDWSAFDGGARGARRDAERADLAAQLAELTATLHPLRMQVLDAYFNALLLQEGVREIDALIDDLDARLREVRAQVTAGAALPGDTAALRAELLTAMQQRAELAADRRAVLDVLSQLSGRTIAPDDVLALPALDTEIVRADVATDTTTGDILPTIHPQYAAFAARRAQLESQTEVIAARRQPQVGAFGELAWGSPGFAQFTDEPHDYWIAGLRVQWAPWQWGMVQRDVEAVRVAQQIVATEEAAFTARLRREVQQPLAAMQRLREALETDAQIVTLREQVERQARAQFAERAITAADYVDALSDLQEARIARTRHRIELARAQAQYLTTLGLEVR